MKVQGVVFDLDGTLADSLAMTFDAFNHAITSLGGKLHTPQEIMAYFGAGEGAIFARILGEEKADEAYALSMKYTDDHLGQVPLFEGIGELLHQLEVAGLPCSIFTGRSWPTTEMILRHHGLENRFETVVCHDHVRESKPSPEGLLLCLERMKLRPEEVLFVGDSHQDIRAGRSAGSPTVAALWDLLADREHLARFQPSHFAEKPGELWRLIESLQKT